MAGQPTQRVHSSLCPEMGLQEHATISGVLYVGPSPPWVPFLVNVVAILAEAGWYLANGRAEAYPCCGSKHCNSPRQTCFLKTCASGSRRGVGPARWWRRFGPCGLPVAHLARTTQHKLSTILFHQGAQQKQPLPPRAARTGPSPSHVSMVVSGVGLWTVCLHHSLFPDFPTPLLFL